ncbi:hypothetical protein GCM10011348_17620 [Marinobacterium nitratireducens]|uniref:Uncharacterized protein n=1 Tax=Marinobacterium nitratireducens TaxID=518897 RepID=A0A918DSJ1_9GAMM|nr:hypothetical protein [Marinobacterium nitratireducens]GGO80595.1 hypothetical protein GCM10011348_17620 [Marinobacterium nitratireducens]
MDPTAYLIIAVATATAIAFKWYLYRRIRAWVERDLIRGLANGDSGLQMQLEREYASLRQQGLSRRDAQARLQQRAGAHDPGQ